jgi:hypothetical protein
MIYAIGVFALVGAALWLATRRGANLAATHARRLQAALRQPPAAPALVLTEQDIAHLPAPVQRYLRVSGSIGLPRIRNLKILFDAEMFRKAGQAAIRGPAEQFDRFDRPRRLFFMRTRMFGLPVAVLHDYDDTRASMVVRIASLFNVVNAHGDALARTETVTVLNDLCLFAPSWLTDPRLDWRPIDSQSAGVSLTLGPHRVSATLVFDESGDLVNFSSEDRGALQSDGSLRLFRWSTPVSQYREFVGRRVATWGEAIWHYPEGDFVYGRFALREIRFDVTP